MSELIYLFEFSYFVEIIMFAHLVSKYTVNLAISYLQNLRQYNLKNAVNNVIVKSKIQFVSIFSLR